VLANGPGGWVQTANFMITGPMVIAVAVGFRRALAPKSLAVSLFLGAFGASMLVAAVFRADPMDGFPVMSRRNVPSLARLSLLAGIIILLGFFGGMAVPHSSPVLGIWIAVIVGWAWLAVMSRYLIGVDVGTHVA